MRSSFTQSDVFRALKAAHRAGMRVERFEISKDGKIIVVAKSSHALSDDLDRELREFEDRHGEG